MLASPETKTFAVPLRYIISDYICLEFVKSLSNVFIKANLILVRMHLVVIDLFTLLIMALQFVRDITMLFCFGLRITHGASGGK